MKEGNNACVRALEKKNALLTETESLDSPFLIGGSEIRQFALLLIARLQFGNAGNAIERAKNLLFVVTASDISADESVLRADLTRHAARSPVWMCDDSY